MKHEPTPEELKTPLWSGYIPRPEPLDWPSWEAVQVQYPDLCEEEQGWILEEQIIRKLEEKNEGN